MNKFIELRTKFVEKFLPSLSGIPALFIRLYLAPVFIIAGYSKSQFSDPSISGISSIFANENTVAWFGNTEWGLGLPMPELLANLAVWAELFGGFFLIIGLFTRLVSIPLMFTMFVAATSVHATNGWFAITPTNPDTSPALVLSWFNIPGAEVSLRNSESTGQKLEMMRTILDENGNTNWLYENGSIVVLNNGVEFAVTYFILLLALFFIGAGRYTSIDSYLLSRYERIHAQASKID